MRKFLVRLLCCFIPSRKLRHKIPEDNNFIVTGINNKIVTVDENGKEYEITNGFPGFRFLVTGNNCTVKIHTPLISTFTVIECKNDNCYIEIGSSKGPFSVHIECVSGQNQKVIIGKDTTIGDACIVCNEQAQVLIGSDCMLSGMIRIWGADGHSVLDAKTGKILNEATKPLIIENHVWIGEGARLTKKAHIHENSIVSGGAVAYKDYKEKGVIIAGNPGEIVKNSITWGRTDPYHLKLQRKK